MNITPIFIHSFQTMLFKSTTVGRQQKIEGWANSLRKNINKEMAAWVKGKAFHSQSMK